jgi:hypothetical protein
MCLRVSVKAPGGVNGEGPFAAMDPPDVWRGKAQGTGLQKPIEGPRPRAEGRRSRPSGSWALWSPIRPQPEGPALRTSLDRRKSWGRRSVAVHRRRRSREDVLNTRMPRHLSENGATRGSHGARGEPLIINVQFVSAGRQIHCLRLSGES